LAAKNKTKFVLIELADPSVVHVLTCLRDLLGKKTKSTAVHITIRGPYGRDPRKPSLEKIEKRVRGEPLLISGAGRFRNGSTHVIYLKVGARFLREMWWKPDYPAEKYGFNPHITIYEGEDEETADLVFWFLKKEKLELLCFEYKIRVHDRRLPVLIRADRTDPKPQGSVRWGRVAPGLLERAARIAKSVNLTARQRTLF
jgi:hypothetical protein